MGRKRSLRDSEEVKYHGEMEGAEVQSDDGDANGDLSLGILAKANDRRLKRNSSFGKGPSPEIRTRNGAEPSVDHEGNDAENKGLEIDPEADDFKESILNGERIEPAKEPAVLETASGSANAMASIVEAIQKKKKKKKKKINDDQKMGEVEDSEAKRKFLRGPRYFDPPEEWEQLCHNCGEPGHYSANCVERRQKPCYVCGDLGHEAKDCLQGIECFSCKKTGHYVKNCPEKRSKAKRNNTTLRICLFCGDSGHDISSCGNGYHRDDMKEIQCYICKHFGHLCCVDVMDSCPRELSCYNCGEKGHTGPGCAKSQGQGQGGTAKTCFKCGEEGHFARGCTRDDNFDRWIADPATPSNECSQEDTGFFGFRSVPREFVKLPEWEDVQAEGRKSVASGEFRSRNSWSGDTAEGCIYTTPCQIDDVQAEGRKSVASVEFRSRNSWRGDTAEGCIYTTPRKIDGWDPHLETVGFRGRETASDSNEQYANDQMWRKSKFSPYTRNSFHNSNGWHRKSTASKSRGYRRRDGWRE